MFEFALPLCSPHDIQWACSLFDLPDGAFGADIGSDSRLRVLTCNDSLDVEACPGSGKTTLLTAKLAIFAKNWRSATRGVCVLSHTNVARQEIEERLAAVELPSDLLRAPHFIGTIHSFINEFLALPCLRSLGIPVRMIDDATCERHRRSLLQQSRFASLATYVNRKEQTSNNNVVSEWTIVNSGFDVVRSDGEPEFIDSSGRAASELRMLARQCARDGFYRFDEMLIWAQHLITAAPELILALRWRFPILFVDEFQDTNRAQAKLLHRLFVEGKAPVIRQRFGDSNQAIYRYAQLENDRFPDSTIRVDIDHSNRFGQLIADAAVPLAFTPQSLKGLGPKPGLMFPESDHRPTILLFENNTIESVLPTFGQLLIRLFPQRHLDTGVFKAVGAVHRSTSNTNSPRHVGHYWPHYDPTLANATSTLSSFIKYIHLAKALTRTSGDAFLVFEKSAEALLALTALLNPFRAPDKSRRKHLQVTELLGENSQVGRRYLDFLLSVSASSSGTTKTEWDSYGRAVVLQAASHIAESTQQSPAIDKFLEWESPTVNPVLTRDTDRTSNVFLYPEVNPKVRIELGSIHSVKGETHTATLVLETFYFEHNLKSLKPWLLNRITGGNEASLRNQNRLRQHYVAMTRPSHFLALAMRSDSFSGPEIAQISQKWRIIKLTSDSN